jgi:hypothetical protein
VGTDKEKPGGKEEIGGRKAMEQSVQVVIFVVLLFIAGAMMNH